MSVDHPAVVAVPQGGGAFALEPEGGRTGRILVQPESDGGFRVEGQGIEASWRMLRDDGPNGGFVVLAPEAGRELGRSVGQGRLGLRREMRYVLLGDGSLFRVAPAGSGAGGFDVSGYETEGPYLTARLEPGGWRIAPTPACYGLEDLRVLSVLVAAEILAAGERYGSDRTV